MSDMQNKIAIIGMACRVPGATNYMDFWQLLLDGRVVTGDWPLARQILSEAWSKSRDGHQRCAKDYETIMSGGYLDDIAAFDNKLFGLSPKEAKVIDPQQRMLMEEAWSALQDAGIDPRSLAGQDVAVLMGVCAPDYSLVGHEAGPSTTPYSVLGSAPCMAANRISYALDLRGASMTVDAACSASAHAIHLAVNQLLVGDCTLALAGGATAILTPTVNAGFETAHMLSKSKRCKTFDKSADGYVRSEGAGVVVLKPLQQAIANNDPIHGVIEATALNQDGRTKGIAMPSRSAQVSLHQTCLKKAGLAPVDIDFIEAHGTGTPAGDPTEASALAETFAGLQPKRLVGTLKANIGHTEAASGVLAVIKAVLAMKYRLLPKQVGSTDTLDVLDAEQSGIGLPQDNTLLPTADEKLSLHALISAFGFGGSNAGIVVGSWPAQPGATLAVPEYLSLSGHTAKTLTALLEKWQIYSDRVSEQQFSVAKMFAQSAYSGEQIKVDVPAANLATAKHHLAAILTRLNTGDTKVLEEYAASAVRQSWPLHTHPEPPLPTFPFDKQQMWAAHLQMPVMQDLQLPTSIALDFGQQYISDHRIADEIIVPGASMLIALKKALSQQDESSQCRVRNVDFKSAFIIRDKASSLAQLIIKKTSEKTYSFDLLQLETHLLIASGEIIFSE